MKLDSRAQWRSFPGSFETYEVLRGKLFHTCRGWRVHVLSFCLEDEEQGPVVALPIVYPAGVCTEAQIRYCLPTA